MFPVYDGISSRYKLGHHVSSSSCDIKISYKDTKKKKVMELAEPEYVLGAAFGSCPKGCHTAYKNGVQEWRVRGGRGQRGSQIKGSGRRSARLACGLGGG